MFFSMGGKDPNRQPKLSSLKITPVGYVRLARCDRLIRKHVEFALVTVRCTACRGVGARAVMLRLCDPECPKQRG